MSKLQDLKWLFSGRHFDREVIVLCVRWYLRYKLSLRDLVEMMAERGLSLAHTTILRWVKPLHTGVRQTLATGGLRGRSVVAGRRDLREGSRQVVLISIAPLTGRERRSISPQHQARRRGSKGVLRKAIKDSADALRRRSHWTATRHLTGRCRELTSRRLAAPAHEVTVVEVPEQPDRARSPTHQIAGRT